MSDNNQNGGQLTEQEIYEQQMREYEEKMRIYNEQMKEYEEKMRIYNEQQAAMQANQAAAPVETPVAEPVVAPVEAPTAEPVMQPQVAEPAMQVAQPVAEPAMQAAQPVQATPAMQYGAPSQFNPQYTQPVANPAMQPANPAMQPTGPATPADALGRMPADKAPKTPMNPGSLKKVGIIAGAAAAVVLVGAILVNTVVFTPKTKVLKAFEKTYGRDALASNIIDEEIGIDTMLETLHKKGGHASIKGEMTRDGQTYTGKLSFDKNTSKKNMSIEALIEGDKSQGEEMKGMFIADKDNTYVGFTGVDGYFAIKNKNIYEQINNSPLMENGNKIDYDKDVSIDWFSDEIIQLPDSKDNEEVKKAYLKIVNDLNENIEVKSNGKESVTIGGKNKKAKKYDVALDDKAVDRLIADFGDLYKTIYESQLENLPEEAKSNLDLDDLNSQIDEIVTQAQDFTTDDVAMDVFVYGGKIAGFYAQYSIEDGGDKVKCSADVRNEGAKNILSDFSVDISATDGGQNMGVKFSQVTEEAKSYKSQEIDFSLYGTGSENATGKVVVELGNKGDLSIDVNMSDDRHSDNAKIEGKFSNVKKGKSFTFKLDSINVGGRELTENIDLSVNVDANPGKAEPLTVSGKDNVLYVLESSEDEIQKFVEDNMEEGNNPLSNYFGKSKKSEAIQEADTIRTAAYTAMANEDGWDQVYSNYEKAKYVTTIDDENVYVVASAPFGGEFTEAAGIKSMPAFIDEVNNCLGNNSGKGYKSDAGKGVPTHWNIAISEYFSGYIILATDDDEFAYILTPYPCEEFEY